MTIVTDETELVVLDDASEMGTVVERSVERVIAYDVAINGTVQPAIKRTVNIENPGGPDEADGFFTDVPINLIEVRYVLRDVSGAAPSINANVYFAADRSAVGTAVHAAAVTVTNTSTGQTAVIANGSIPADSWVWVELTTLVDVVGHLAVSIHGEAT